MELMRNERLFRMGINSDDFIKPGEGEEGNPNLPKNIEDTDRINLLNVVEVSRPK